MELAACPACHRHVRAGERSCPFCSAATDAQPVRRGLVGRASRAAVFASAATLAGCYTDANTPPPQPVKPVATEGTVTGTLRQANNESAVGVAVTAISDQGNSATAVTDANGRYRFEKLRPGWYVIQFEPGRRRMKPNATRVEVKAGDTAQVDGVLRGIDPDTACCMPYGAPPARRRLV